MDRSKEEFVNKSCHINGIEGFWGLAETRLFKFKGLPKKTFYLHLNKGEFRCNSRKELVSLKNIKGNEITPFTFKLKGKMFLQPRANAIIAKGQAIYDTNTEEVIDESVLIGRRKVVDKSQFAKIYASKVGTLYELSRPAQNVFLYLTKVMDYENKAIFDYKKEYQKLGYKSEM